MRKIDTKIVDLMKKTMEEIQPERLAWGLRMWVEFKLGTADEFYERFPEAMQIKS